MKKILGISLVALFAATPMMAKADPITKINAATPDPNTSIATTSYVKGAYKDLAGHIDTNIEAINKLNGDAGTAGSVANSIVAERSAAAALTSKTIDADSNIISNIETDNFKSSAIAESISSDAVNTKLATEKAVADAIKDVNTAAATLSDTVAGHTTAINLLNAGDSTEGSVAYAVAQEASARDTAIETAINSEESDRNTAIATAIASEVTNRDTAISNAITSEVTNRNAAISAAITSEVTNRNAAISAAITELNLDNTYDAKGAASAAETAAKAYADSAAASALQSAEAYVDAKSLAVTTTWGTEATSAIQFSDLNPTQSAGSQEG